MPTSSREILDQIADLQISLEGFSFEQLTVAEAQALKSSFNHFRTRLESRLWAPDERLQAGSPNDQAAEGQETPTQEEAVNKILATVGHEMRTPLHAISELAQLLRQGKLSGQQAEQVNAIHTASETLLQLVGELLEYSRFHSDQEPVASIAFSPKQLIEQVGYLCSTLIVSKSVSFKIDLDPQTPHLLLGDPSKFSQILMNLLGNAIKFVGEGQIELQVWPENQPGRCLLHGAIRDTGPGIAPGELPFIFDAFRQGTGSHANPQGIGLGLSIVKKTLDRLGGSISAESQEGVGTAFRFSIPFRLAEGSVPSEPATEYRDRPLSGKTILIIEDNLLNQKLLATRLKGWGCRVLTSEKAVYGIGLLSQEKPDLILMDLRLPGMDGYQASLRIRNHREAAISRIPIVAVTADFTAADSEQVRRAGINDVVLKPYSADELLEKLIQQLNAPSMLMPATEAAEQEAPGVLDLANLWNECAGDLEMLEELVRLFRANLLEFLGALKTNLTLLDYEQIESCAHKIKAGLKLMEVYKWLAKVEELRELNRKQSGVARMRQIYRELLGSFPELDSELERALEQIKKDKPHG